MAEIIIFGNGQIGELAEFYFRKDSAHKVVAFTANKEFIKSNKFCGLPLIPFDKIENLYRPSKYKMFIALSYKDMNKLRAEKYYQAKSKGYKLVSYVSSKCTFLTETAIGDNCFILENNTIQPFVKIGNNVVLWSGNHIGHESQIGDHCNITSHVVISGNVIIKPYCFIGVNATIRDSITIERETLIGAGSVIMKSTVEKGVYLPPRATLFSKKSNEITI